MNPRDQAILTVNARRMEPDDVADLLGPFNSTDAKATDRWRVVLESEKGGVSRETLTGTKMRIGSDGIGAIRAVGGRRKFHHSDVIELSWLGPVDVPDRDGEITGEPLTGWMPVDE